MTGQLANDRLSSDVIQTMMCVCVSWEGGVRLAGERTVMLNYTKSFWRSS